MHGLSPSMAREYSQPGGFELNIEFKIISAIFMCHEKNKKGRDQKKEQKKIKC